MKEIKIILCLMMFVSIGMNAQNNAASRIAIQVEMPKNLTVSNDASMILFNRLTQAVALNGLGSYSSKFIMVPIVSIVSKEITTNIPQQVVVDLELSLFIVDNSRQIILQQESIELKGIADTEQKAILKAITNLKARHPKLKNLIVRGKDKIVNYYETQCDDVMNIVLAYLNREMYKEAILELQSIPAEPETMPCYQKAQQIFLEVNDAKRAEAEKKLSESEANIEWLNKTSN
ncbi:hypothetical protein LJC25_00140 [Bacteroidales bacterium OttesenSCG-928-K03]|nr:hypothetical protein [Bacteroidales bacterium OttesenSCG-928-K03]